VVEAGSGRERRHLAVRDFLRVHPAEAARYAALKREVAARHAGDRLAYIAAKQDYMTALEQRSLDWQSSQDKT